MTQTDAKALLEKYKLGTCTAAEKDIVETWYQNSGIDKGDQLSDQAIDESLDQVWNKLNADDSAIKVVRLWPRIAITAAVATIIVSAGIWFYGRKQVLENGIQIAYQSDVAPGKAGATLTLASGRKIRLSDAVNGKLAEEAGVTISKSADGQLVYEIKGTDSDPDKINTLSTAKGETYNVRLPDGSLVYLNAASSLTYAASLFERGKRMVRLSGEGYFEIFKDKAHPFIVESKGQQVEVLGTHFNINAYANEPTIKTTLLEGSINVSRLSVSNSQSGESNDVLLKPGQQSVFSSKGIKVSEADTETAVAWKNSQFSFESEDIQTVMRMVERWYNVEVVYNGEITDEKFGGGVSRFDNVSKVLKSLESTGKVHFKIEGRRVYVSR